MAREPGFYWVRFEDEVQVAEWVGASTWGRPAWHFVWKEYDMVDGPNVEVLSKRLLPPGPHESWCESLVGGDCGCPQSVFNLQTQSKP